MKNYNKENIEGLEKIIRGCKYLKDAIDTWIYAHERVKKGFEFAEEHDEIYDPIEDASMLLRARQELENGIKNSCLENVLKEILNGL